MNNHITAATRPCIHAHTKKCGVCAVDFICHPQYDRHTKRSTTVTERFLPTQCAVRLVRISTLPIPPLWLALVLAALAGALLTLGFAPYDATLVAFVALPVLFLLSVRTRKPWQAFLLGWVFAVGHHYTALGWIANALLVDTQQFAALIPLAKLGIPAYLGLFTGTVCYAVRRFMRTPPTALLLFAGLWSLAEYARSYLLLPFAWNLTGYVWASNSVMAQSVALMGIPGLGLLTVLAAGGLALPFLAARPVALRWNLLSLGVLLLLAAFGTVRMVAAGTDSTGHTVRLVQPNISQHLKWDPNAAETNFQTLLRLTRTPADRRIAAVIWPESAVAWRLDTDVPHRLAAVSSLPVGAVLVAGFNRWDTPPAGERHGHPYNSLFVFDRGGDILATYDKRRLVPFGEYVPLRWLFNVDKATGGAMLDFIPGTQGTMTVTETGSMGLPGFSPLICYEVIYPGNVAAHGNARPGWLLNITNDAWFGKSAGPYQHLAMARMRSIEEGLPLVRVANTGITTVADAWGRSLVQTQLDTQQVLDIPLPIALSPPLFARLGHLIPGGMVLGILMLAVCGWRKRTVV
jgi:apolipoprotein N-acyltransferase